jgi:uncharacterized protein YceH (UPF0502 family)
VELTLDALADLATPLVTKLPRRPGQKEVRYAHLLAGGPGPEEAPDDAPRRETPRRPSSSDRVQELEAAVDALRAEVTALRADLDALLGQLE